MPLHKIPLCSFKYVGDVYSNGNFIYINQQKISKSKPIFLSNSEDKGIGIEKQKCFKMNDILNIDANIKQYNLFKNEMKINKFNQNILIEAFEQWGNICTKKKLINRENQIKRINKESNYNMARTISDMYNIKNNIWMPKESFNISKVQNNNELFKNITEGDSFSHGFTYYLDDIIDNINLEQIRNLSKDYHNIKMNYNLLLSDQGMIINTINLSKKYLNKSNYRIYEDLNPLYIDKESKNFKLTECNNSVAKPLVFDLNKFQFQFVDKYGINMDLCGLDRLLDTTYENFHINKDSIFLDNTYKDFYKKNINNYMEKHVSYMHLNNIVKYINPYERYIYQALNLKFLKRDMRDLESDILEKSFLEKQSIDIFDKYNSNFIMKTFKDIIMNNYLYAFDKRYKEVFIDALKNVDSISGDDTFNYNNIYAIEKKQNLITKNIKNNLLGNNYVDFNKYDSNKMIGELYTEIDFNNCNMILNQIYKNIIKSSKDDLLEQIFKDKTLYLKENTMLLHKNNKIIELDLCKDNKNLESYMKQINESNVFKHLKIDINEVGNIKTYKQLSKHSKKIHDVKENLLDKSSKSICKDEVQLFSKRKKGIEKHNKNTLVNKIYAKINIQRYEKLIGKTYIKINKDINDKNIERIIPNNINKNESKELQHICINEMSNNLYDNMLKKVMPVAEIFKENNVFLDKITQRRHLFKQTNYLLQNIYQDDAVKHIFNNLEYLKQMNISKEECDYLGKYNKDLTYINNNNNLKKYKKDINKENQKYTEVTERWWVLNSTAPFDKKILPFDYDYSKMPLVSNNNIINTSKIIDKHPISFAPYMIDSNNGGKDLDFGTKEIDVSIEIMLDMVNIVGMIVLQDVNKFKNCTGQEALEFILELIFDWLNMDSTIKKMGQNNSREHYLRCYRWIRWEAEQLWFEADKDHTIHKNLGIKFAGALLGKLIEYMKYHHFDIVPLWRNLRFMDIERQFNKAKNEDIFKGVDKIKSYRHYMIDTQILTKQHLFQK